MATAVMIEALRNAARKLHTSTDYQWGHMGLCNCGFLAQEVTRLTKSEIHRHAMAKPGDWSEQLNDYCPTSGMPMDDLITELLHAGFSRQNLIDLERLADSKILAFLPGNRKNLKHNVKQDVILYLNTWASYLEAAFSESISLRELEPSVASA
ncbi:MAG: hypothetical protein J0L66_14680 [Cytophagales bacterium]|nr:hypothetical protein [Cytophagales bacterium]